MSKIKEKWSNAKTWQKVAVIIVALLIVRSAFTSDGEVDEPAPVAVEEPAEPEQVEEPEPVEEPVEEQDAPEEEVEIGEEARDGQFEFTVNGLEDIGNVIEADNDFFDDLQASGTFYELDITVENIGNESRSLDSSDQYLVDVDGRKFSAISAFDLIGFDRFDDSPVYEQINPGLTVSGKIIFDVPEGVEIEFAELHDSMFSNGVLISLQ